MSEVAEIPTLVQAEPNQRPRRPIAPLAIGVLAAAVSVAGAVFVVRGVGLKAPEGPIRLAVGFRAGEKYDYRIEMTMRGTWDFSGVEQDIDSKVAGDASFDVTSVDEEGLMTMRLSMGQLTGEVNSENISQPGTTVALEITPDGRIYTPGTTPLGGSTNTPGSSSFGQLVPALPNHRVEPGDTWKNTWEQPFPLGEGTSKMVTTSELLRYEKFNGVTTAVIRLTGRSTGTTSADFSRIAGLLGGAPEVAALAESGLSLAMDHDLKIDSTYWLDPIEGDVLKVDGASDGEINQQLEGEIPPGLGPGLSALRDASFRGIERMVMERT